LSLKRVVLAETLKAKARGDVGGHSEIIK